MIESNKAVLITRATGNAGYWSRLWNRMVQHKYMYLLALPGILFFMIFKFAPMGAAACF